MRVMSWGTENSCRLHLSPGLQWAFGCTASHSAPKGLLQLSIPGCLEGKGLAGSTFKESSLADINSGSGVWPTTWRCQPSHRNIAAAFMC